MECITSGINDLTPSIFASHSQRGLQMERGVCCVRSVLPPRSGRAGVGFGVKITPCQSKTLRLRSGQASSRDKQSQKENSNVPANYGEI